jgi:hypothetical protein
MTNQTDTKSTKTEAKLPFETFDPMAMWSRSQEMMRDLFEGSVTRARAFADQVSTWERDAVTRANAAVDAWAQLAHDSISYSAQLASEARKLGFESLRHVSPA